MTSRERMVTAMWNRQPDMAPVAPDMSNMIPCRLTGKPFWDIYLYQNPPLWKAYIHAAKRYGFDGWLAGASIQFNLELPKDGLKRGRAIVKRTNDRIFVRGYTACDGKTLWASDLTVYYRDMPPTNLAAKRIGMDDAAAGGGFILSTADQCGHDMPEENICRLIETARRYGKY